MKYAVYPQPVLGPCGCRECGESLYWARRNTRVDNVVVGSLRWRDWTGRIHKCPGKPRLPGGRGRPKSQIRHESVHLHGPTLSLSRARANGYNGAVSSSDESNTIANGTRVLATTHDAGVIAFRGSSS